MSEEQPVFKVTDRRLFNPDGTPREVERREEDAQPAPSATGTADTSVTAAPDASASGAASASNINAAPETGAGARASASPAEQRAADTSASEAGRASASDAREPQGFEAEDELGEGDVPGADDPASFVNFLMSIASNAAAALGMMEHPATGQRGVDLALGKHWIDVLGMLRQKTRGNLAPQEQQILEGILADLRMQYVSLNSAASRPSGPRGFTGRDIIGGK